MLSGQVADGVAGPLVGILSDRTQSGCVRLGLGKRKSWNAAGVVLVMFTYIFVFGFCLPCLFSGYAVSDTCSPSFQVLKTTTYSMACALFNVGWAAVQVSHMTLVAELTRDEGSRVLLNAVRYGNTVNANIVVFIAMAVLLHIMPGGAAEAKSNPETYTYLALFNVTFGGICSLLFLIFLKERTGCHSYQRLSDKDAHTPLLIEDATEQGVRALTPVEEDRAMSGKDYHASAVMGSLNASDNDESVPLTQPRRLSASSVGAEVSSLLLEGAGLVDCHATADDQRIMAAARRREESDCQPCAELQSRSREISSISIGAERSLQLAEAASFRAWKDWFSLTMFYAVGLNYMATRIAINVSQVYITFYLTSTRILPANAIALVPLVIYIASFLCTAIVKRLSKLLGASITYAIGSVLVAGAAMVFLFANEHAAWIVYVGAFLLGFGNAAIMVTSVSYEATLVGDSCPSGAFVYGIFSMADKVSNGLIVVGIQQLTSNLNCQDHGDDPLPAHCATFYMDVVAWVPLVAAATGTAAAFALRHMGLRN